MSASRSFPVCQDDRQTERMELFVLINSVQDENKSNFFRDRLSQRIHAGAAELLPISFLYLTL